MRMWMIDPRLLCRQHLLGEHRELHYLEGHLRNGNNVTWAVERGFVDPSKLKTRHAELVREFKRRGYNHNSPVGWLPRKLATGKIDLEYNRVDLRERCARCAERITADWE